MLCNNYKKLENKKEVNFIDAYNQHQEDLLNSNQSKKPAIFLISAGVILLLIIVFLIIASILFDKKNDPATDLVDPTPTEITALYPEQADSISPFPPPSRSPSKEPVSRYEEYRLNLKPPNVSFDLPPELRQINCDFMTVVSPQHPEICEIIIGHTYRASQEGVPPFIMVNRITYEDDFSTFSSVDEILDHWVEIEEKEHEECLAETGQPCLPKAPGFMKRAQSLPDLSFKNQPYPVEVNRNTIAAGAGGGRGNEYTFWSLIDGQAYDITVYAPQDSKYSELIISTLETIEIME